MGGSPLIVSRERFVTWRVSPRFRQVRRARSPPPMTWTCPSPRLYPTWRDQFGLAPQRSNAPPLPRRPHPSRCRSVPARRRLRRTKLRPVRSGRAPPSTCQSLPPPAPMEAGHYLSEVSKAPPLTTPRGYPTVPQLAGGCRLSTVHRHRSLRYAQGQALFVVRPKGDKPD